MSELPVDRSPRSDDEPMAFTRDEQWRGAGMAWLAFVVLMLVALTVSAIASAIDAAADPSAVEMGSSIALLPVVLFYALLLGGGIAFVVLIIGLPVTWVIGRAMRRVRRIAWHMAVYAALGAMIGLLAVSVYASFQPYDPSSAFSGPLLPWTVSITTTAVVFGWWRGSRHARRELRTRPEPSPLGLERAFDEDGSPY